MKHQPTEDRLPGGWLRRIAERIASRPACERVLFPLLADLQFEHTRARGRWARVVVQARGVLAFWRALGLTSVIDGGQHLWANAWATSAEEATATKRLFGTCCGATIAAVLVLMTFDWHRVRMIPGNVLALLLPSALVAALPVGVLLAFALRAGGGSILAQRRGPQSMAVLAVLATFVVAAWLTPAANQEYRARVSRLIAPQFVPLERGDREMTLDELSVHSGELRLRGWNEHAARFDVEWHKKPALAALCLALALAGAAIAVATRRGVLRLFAAVVVAWVPWPLLRIGEQAADDGHLSPALAMWGPVVLVAVGALAALRLAQRRQAKSSPDSFGAGSSPA